MIARIREFLLFFKEIYAQRSTIWSLGVNDFKVRYTNSYLGIIWGFAQPVIQILMFYFIFDIGFRNPPVEDAPFLIWIMCGLIPWTFYSETISSGTNCLVEYSYLIKKVVFRVSMLPLVKVISSLIVHVVFISFIIIVMLMYNYKIDWYCMQLFYYLLCMVILVTGVTWITSAVSVFVKDVKELVSVFLQFGFWFAPIVWNFSMIENDLKWIFKLNPFYYIIQGYRDAFIYKVYFWDSIRLLDGLYFWSISLSLFILGAVIFRKLRPHFADLL